MAERKIAESQYEKSEEIEREDGVTVVRWNNKEDKTLSHENYFKGKGQDSVYLGKKEFYIDDNGNKCAREYNGQNELVTEGPVDENGAFIEQAQVRVAANEREAGGAGGPPPPDGPNGPNGPRDPNDPNSGAAAAGSNGPDGPDDPDNDKPGKEDGFTFGEHLGEVKDGNLTELEEELWRTAWKNKLLDFDHTEKDPEFPLSQCRPGTIHTIRKDPPIVGMDLESGAKLLNSSNKVCLDHSEDLKESDVMTMVRLGKEKGITSAKIDPSASPEFKRLTYIEMLAQGIAVENAGQLGFTKEQLEELQKAAEKKKETYEKDFQRAEELDGNYSKLGLENDAEKFEKFEKKDYKKLKEGLTQETTTEREPAAEEQEILNDVTVERVDKETGITHLETFKNGNVVSDSTFDKNGKALEDKTWDESGKPLSEKTYAEDGINPAKEVVYDYDGDKLTGRVETVYNPDGTHKTTVYDAEGKAVPDKPKEQSQEQTVEPQTTQKTAVQQMENFQKEVAKEAGLKKQEGQEGKDYDAAQVEAGYQGLSDDKKNKLSQKFGTIVLKFCEQYPEQAKALAEDLKKPENASFAKKMQTLGNAFNAVKGQEVSGRTKAEKEDLKLRADIMKSLQSSRGKD
ncbi:MAG: hypothetical protein IJ846_07490 [Alphaproteobacteria bacterium]|nr:hypothetical protein [Alphaproteobacteria bacterium]